MAGNCIPVIPRPNAGNIAMHSRLIPEVHYIEIKSDFSDVDVKIQYYKDHPEEARNFSEASKEWIRQFSDEKREL
ncbi:MAG: hypothetical protein K2K64_07305 [Muribaculaceae bacterium]|nr:hypothetical protein [Muribaculaceae bacterium]